VENLVASRKKPVLFEVVARSRRSRGRAAQKTVRQQTAHKPAPPAQPEHGQPAAPGGTATPTRRPPAVSTQAGRLHLVLGWPHLVVAGVLAAVVLWATVQAGARSARPRPENPDSSMAAIIGDNPPDTPDQQPALPTPTPVAGDSRVAIPDDGSAGDDVESTMDGGEADQEGEPGDDFSFEPGSYYVVIQYFRTRNRDHAYAARNFLRANGVDCIVHRGRGDYQLVATQRFASPQGADALIRRIQTLGAEYQRSGGGYGFQEPRALKF
jgi:hypothetical protein